MLSWFVSVGLLCSLWLYLARRNGPDIAIGAVVLVGCLCPTWCYVNIGEQPLLARLAGTIFALVAYLFHPRSKYPVRLGWIDWVMIFLLLLNLLSDTINDGFRISTIGRMYGEWFVPYVAGRLAFQNSSSFKQLAPYGIFAAIVLGALGTIEALTGIHPWELVYGLRLDEDTPRNMPRWGLQRAWGPCEHPIYFGMLQVMFLPWLLSAWHSRESSWKNWIARFGSLIGPLGIVGTASRAPLIGSLLLPSIWTFVSLRKTRIIMAGLVLVGVLAGIVAKDKVITLVHQFGGEKLDGHGRKIIVDGSEVEKTSAMTRLYLLQVYRRAAIRAGLIGFGTESVTGFPVRVPVGPEDSTALRNIWAIDNAYLLLTLRFGWFGGAAFLLAIVMAGVAWIRRASNLSGSDRAFNIYVGAAILAVGLGLFTVWMPQDIGFPLLFLMGGVSCRQSIQHTTGDRSSPHRKSKI